MKKHHMLILGGILVAGAAYYFLVYKKTPTVTTAPVTGTVTGADGKTITVNGGTGYLHR